ncbi:MAG: alkaline phosphatase family protein [Kiritimatiellia bacterium]
MSVDLTGLCPSLAYIGPGAGFAFVGSFLILFSALVLVAAAVLSWPFRLVLSVFLRRGRKRDKTGIRRVVIVGLDGLDAKRTQRLMEEGRLPNFSALRDRGCFKPLLSTCPPISPVAWSSFMTGVNPGKHNIYDFLNRGLGTYLPELSSSRIGSGRKSYAKLLRKSRPFWHVAGEYGIFSTILRVPITFPPEKFNGVCLSGMCVPDLRGTQGSFTCFTDRVQESPLEGGLQIRADFSNGRAKCFLPGPEIRPGSPLQVPLTIEREQDDTAVCIAVCGQKIRLKQGQTSEWISVRFKAGLFRSAYGLCRLYFASDDKGFRLYVTPLNIDPARPALPVSHPSYYSVYLARLLGPFATLGLAEDTWALNEGVIDDDAFVQQVYSIHEERRAMLFESLKRTKKGIVACVFDASDRIQHMFTRASGDGDAVVDSMYGKMDRLVGEVSSKMCEGDLLMVMSDHGFTSFRQGFNLNAWLLREGFLHLLPDSKEDKYLQAVDWSRTRAYSFGLSGIYFNKQGRESRGIVADAEVGALKDEIAARLKKEPAVLRVYDSSAVYHGPYVNNGPDLIVGFREGWRASWESAVGTVQTKVVTENTKVWQGDHCVDQSLVPGVFFCNRPLEGESNPAITDIAPTVLKTMGIPVPSYMDGKPIPLKIMR